MSTATRENEELYFLYGSMSGNAESIARRFHHEAVQTRGYPNAQCLMLNDVIKKKLLDPYLVPASSSSSPPPPLCLVIVCSTTGEGEPPENAMRFRRWIRNLKEKRISEDHAVRYAVLALGDTNYNNFCAAGIWIDVHLEEIGGLRFFAHGEADDAVDVGLTVEPWVAGMWKAMALRTAAGVGRRAFEAMSPPSAEEGGGAAEALETAIIYANASNVCASLALFLLERIVELGGKANLYPIQYFRVSRVLEKPEVLIFLLSTDSDEVTICEDCKCTSRLPPLGPFAGLFLPHAKRLSSLESSFRAAADCGAAAMDVQAEESGQIQADIRAWMADPEIRFYASLCVVGGRMESAPFATELNQVVHEVAREVHLTCLLEEAEEGNGHNAQSPTQPGSPVLSRPIAMSEEDVFGWTESVLESLPGVTADKNSIRMSMDFFFSSRVSAAFGTGGRDCSTTLFSEGEASLTTTTMRQRHHHNSDFQSVSERKNHRGKEKKKQKGDGGDDGSGPLQQQSTLHREQISLSGLLTPLVFLFSGGSSLVAQVAYDMHTRAASHHLRSSLTELSNFRSTGFPRRATFVFIVSGDLTKSMVKILRSLRLLQRDGASFDKVRFALLGIEEVNSPQDAFNACTLELEAVLLSLKAEKIHCTGLADGTKRDSFLKVVEKWEESLWSAVTHPNPSMAYLDESSPNVCPEEVTLNNLFPQPNAWAFNPPLGAGSSNGTVVPTGNDGSGLPVVSTTTENVVIRSLHSPHASTTNLFEQTQHLPFSAPSARHNTTTSLSTEAAGGEAERGVTVISKATTPQKLPPIGDDDDETAARTPAPFHSVSPPPPAPHQLGSPNPTAAFPYESVPLRRENVAYTPVLLLYSSAGMAKTMAAFTKNLSNDLGFPTRVCGLSKMEMTDLVQHPNIILFCENCTSTDVAAGRGSNHLRQQLSNPLLRPDYLSHLRFAILGLGKPCNTAENPTDMWGRLLLRLQASRVFPSAYMTSMSMTHSLGIPWTECVLASFAISPPVVKPGAAASLTRLTTITPAASAQQLEHCIAASSGAHTGNSQPHSMLDPSTNPLEQDGATLADTLGELTTAELDLHGSVLFLYGSSTGMSESIARDLHRESLQRGIPSRVAALQYFHKMNILSASFVVVVCSSCNSHRGGYPDNAQRFGRYIHHREHTKYSNVFHGMRYAVLGLGNAVQYPNTFCIAAVNTDRRLEELGAERFCPLGRVDVSHSIIQSVEQWRQTLFSRVEAISAEETAGREAASKALTATAAGGAAVPFHPAALRQQQFIDATKRPVTGAAKSQWINNPMGDSAESEAHESCVGALVLYAGSAESAALDVSTRLATMLREELNDSLRPVEVWTMNACIKRSWRRVYRYIFFVVVTESGVESSRSPLNAQAFYNTLHLHNTPKDMFTGVLYSVLAIAEKPRAGVGDNNNNNNNTNNQRQFALSEEAMLWGRQLDRRVEALGGARLFARGEVLEPRGGGGEMSWLRGLLSALRTTAVVDARCRKQIMEARRAAKQHPVNPNASSSQMNAGGDKSLVMSSCDDGNLLPTAGGESGGASTSRTPITVPVAADRVMAESGGEVALEEEAEQAYCDCEEDPNTMMCTIHSWRCLTSQPISNTNSTNNTDSSNGAQPPSTTATTTTTTTTATTTTAATSNAGTAGDTAEIHKCTEDNVAGCVFQVNLAVPSPDIRWVPGQTVSVTPCNSLTGVQEVLQLFHLSFTEPFAPASPASGASGQRAALAQEEEMSSTSSAPLANIASVYPGSPLYRVLNFPSTCGSVLQHLVSLTLTRHSKSMFDLLLSNPCLEETSRKRVEGFWESLRLKRVVAMGLSSVLRAVSPASAVPPFRHVVEHLSLLQPRTYSICSSSLYHTPPILALCVKVVPHGVCSNWLYDQCVWSDGLRLNKRVPGELYMAKRSCTIPVALRPPGTFLFPLDQPLTPIIFVGPGTGIAPFRAFLQERQVQMAAARQARRNTNSPLAEQEEDVTSCCSGAASSPLSVCHTITASMEKGSHLAGTGKEDEKKDAATGFGAVELFFGCRRRHEDFLFAEELSAFERSGVLTSMQVAFSREPNDGHYWYGGCYVQDQLIASGLGLCELIIAQKAHVYVCGDANRMAHDVYRAFVDMIQSHLRCSDKSAAAFMEQLVQSGRYLTDVWSTAP